VPIIIYLSTRKQFVADIFIISTTKFIRIKCKIVPNSIFEAVVIMKRPSNSSGIFFKFYALLKGISNNFD